LKSSDKIYLDFTNILTTYLSAKLFHRYLESYMVEKQVGLTMYYLKLLLEIKILYLMFNVIKFIAVLEDLISDVRNRLATKPVILKVHNVKLSFNIWLVLYIYFILYS